MTEEELTFIEENDGHVLGEVVKNLLDSPLGIQDSKVYVKVVDKHIEIGAVKYETMR